MNDQVRAQIIFRDASGWSGHENATSYLDRDTSDAFRYYIGVGLVEAPPGTYATESMLDLMVGDGLSVSLSRTGPELDPHGPAFQSELGSIAPYLEIKVPFMGALFRSGVGILRETRFPATEGKVAYAALYLLRSPAKADRIPLRTLLTVGGAGRDLALRGSEEIPGSFPMGSAISQAYDQSIWGFGPERRGIGTTLRMDVVDECEEYRRLGGIEARTPDQEARFQSLRRGVAGSVMRIGEEDDLFTEFRRRMREAGAERPMAWYPTQTERDLVEEEAGRIVRELHEERETRAPGYR